MGFPHVRNALRTGLFIVAGALLSACQVETTTPVSDRTEGRADERLLGAWRGAPEHEDSAFLYVRERDDGGMDVLLLEYRDGAENKPRRVEWQTAVAWSTKVGDIDLLDVQADGAKYIMAYKFAEDGSFRFGFMEPEPFIAAVKAGKLKTRDNKGWTGSSLTLDDTPQRISAFIRDNGGYELFGIGDGNKPFRMVRYSPE